MIEVIIFNGPPGCGKDTAADFILKRFPDTAVGLKFAEPLKRAAHEFLCLRSVGAEAHAVFKDRESEAAFGQKLRNVYIALSETWAKPVFGAEIFGKLWLRNFKKLGEAGDPCVVISDCGFADELEPLIEYFGNKSIVLIQIDRPGHTFKGDSRSYVDHPELHVYNLYNNGGDLAAYEKSVFEVLDKAGVLTDL